jgi:hypothetical protein
MFKAVFPDLLVNCASLSAWPVNITSQKTSNFRMLKTTNCAELFEMCKDSLPLGWYFIVLNSVSPHFMTYSLQQLLFFKVKKYVTEMCLMKCILTKFSAVVLFASRFCDCWVLWKFVFSSVFWGFCFKNLVHYFRSFGWNDFFPNTRSL